LEKGKVDKTGYGRGVRRRRFSLKPLIIKARGKAKPRMDSEMTIVGEKT
jgi:ribosomal protein S21